MTIVSILLGLNVRRPAIRPIYQKRVSRPQTTVAERNYMTEIQKGAQALEQLEQKAIELINSSKSDSTKKAYESDWKLFSLWARAQAKDFLPATPETIVLYCTHLHELGRLPSTISRALTAISQAHKIMDFESPTRSTIVGELLKGIKRTNMTPKRQAKPLLLAELKKIVDLRPSYLGLRDKALILIGWAGALRRSELVALNVDDISFVAEGMTVLIKRSKTDQEGDGYIIGIPFAQNESICPVLALQKWIDLSKISKGALFFGVGVSGKGRFHIDMVHPKRLSGRSVNLIIKRRLIQAELSARGYSGHSLRAGFITSAAERETPENLIQIHTRHRSTKILRGYIRRGGVFKNNPLSVLL